MTDKLLHHGVDFGIGDENQIIEIVEYWNKVEQLFEVMLASEYEKKMLKLPYETLHSTNVPPFIITDHRQYKWLVLRTPLTYEEYKNKFK